MQKYQKKKLKELEKLDKVKIGYARTSTLEQNLGMEIQLDSLKECDIIFSEKQSGGKDDRQEFNKAITLAKELAKMNKQVNFCVYKMDRLGRKTSTLLKTIEDLKECGVEFVSVKENIDTTTPTGVLMYQLLGIFSEFELNNIRQRTKEGLRQAKENGVVLGKPALTENKKQQIIKLYQLNSITISEIAKRLNISESSVYKTVRESGIKRRKLTK